MHFTKMEGLGNDYIYVDCTEKTIEQPEKLAVQLSRRRFGIGADGLICIARSKRGEFRMDMYNADGSRGEMCGNGIRCVAKYVYDKGLTKQLQFTIETLAGPRAVQLHTGDDGLVDTVTVDMGVAGVFPRKQISLDGEVFDGIPVSVGNPHFVLFGAHPDQMEPERVGPLLERHPAFPQRTNVEFVSVENADELRMRVWERGSGETLACGTGACAAFAAALHEGRCRHEVSVHLPGGRLNLRHQRKSGHILMTGPARIVYEGEL